MADLKALFPTIAHYHITNLYRTEGCEYIAYERGAFVTNPASVDCELDIEGPQPRMALDAQARTDLDAIYRESERLGAKLQAAFPEYGSDGDIHGGQFGYDWCTSYIYEPAWTALPPQDSVVVTAVDADWYTVGTGC